MLAAFRSKYYLKNMDQIFINGIILNVSEREPLNPGKRKMFGDSGLLSQGPLLLSVSIISEFEVDATGSSMLSWILAFPMSVQLHLTFLFQEFCVSFGQLECTFLVLCFSYGLWNSIKYHFLALGT